jgi:malonyl-CoA O-methyltransferase
LDLLNPPRLDKLSIKNSFDRVYRSYDRAAVLQNEVLSRLLQRLEYIRHQPGAVIDIGCGTGKGIAGLQKRYPRSKIIGLDLAFSMLQESKKKYGFLRRKRMVNSDMEKMPFADGSFDLLFSNLALDWVNDIGATFKEFCRIGRPGSLLMFATFGPGTLDELRESWSRIDQHPHVHQFIDMHDIGDVMMASGFQQPVVDAEVIRLEYKAFQQLFDDLKNTGAVNADIGRSRGLMTPAKLRRLEGYYRQLGYEQGKFIASYEVVYGHAWLP